MAFIAPFRGVRYNPEKISDIRSVVAPPYDVISPEELQDLRSRSPYNVVHIDLPNAEGSSGEDVYTQAGRRFRGWLVEGVLRADERPALYAYHQRYRVPGTDKTLQLTGVIAAVRLARWDEGIILPHEHTFAKPKEDRLRLMRAGEANFSQVYAFYSDPARRADEALAEVTAGRAPDVHTLDDDGASHSVWVVDAPEVVGRVVNALAGTTLYIADGHHRYETALDYRDERRAEVGVDARAGHEYVMMMLVNADGGGLTVLPTHRMVMLPAGIDRSRVEERLRRYFHVTPFEGSEPTRTAEEAAAAIAGDQTSMTLLAGRQGWTLRPRDRGELLDVIDEQASDAWKLLGATILHRVVLEQCFEMSRELQEDGRYITYTRDTVEAVEAAFNGVCDLACILNAPGPDLIMEVARAGDAMPHKSTYFYPKLLTGLVFNDLSLPVGW